MGLDARGGVSVVELLIYGPLFFVCGFLILKHGWRREAWIYLLLFSNARVIGAITHVASELSKTPNTTLHIVFSIMEAAGMSPLFLATLGLLSTAGQHTLLDDQPRIRMLLRILKLTAHGALGLIIVGGVLVGTSKVINTINTGIKLRHVGVIMFIVVLWLTIVVHGIYWSNESRILKQRRKLLVATSCALPFLVVRIIYTTLSAYAPTGIPEVTAGSANLAAFNSTTGSFAAYLLMSFLMELVIVGDYVATGLTTNLNQDYESSKAVDEEAFGLNTGANAAYAPAYDSSQSSLRK